VNFFISYYEAVTISLFIICALSSDINLLMKKKDMQLYFCAINRTETRNICRLILYILGYISGRF